MKNKFFIVGKNKIGYIGANFQTHFGEMEVKIPKKSELEAKTLKKSMTDQEILKEFQPIEVTLGEFAWALKNEKKTLKNSYANIFYIRDKNNILWAVCVGWSDFDRCWLVGANSVDDPRRWDADRLDLYRLGEILDEKYLHTEAAKKKEARDFPLKLLGK